MRQDDAAQDERCSGERTLAQEMPECFLPEELGGPCHFRAGHRRIERLDAHPRALPALQERGRPPRMENAVLANRLCNRIDYSISVGRPYASDLERVRKAREEAIRRNNERPWSPADCWRTGGCWTPTISPACTREGDRKARGRGGLRLVRFLWCGNDGTIRAKASARHGLEGRLDARDRRDRRDAGDERRSTSCSRSTAWGRWASSGSCPTSTRSACCRTRRTPAPC